ncbi:hypothetical protein Cni_G02364 [Canna indica]|uniref:Late embryogenesis abundant protein LEA-2 subgroup domain-containing protein n=1 Tax=Canna indica TaxID=4628 RepID=A0AAQ3JP46_9LILI|nr:hypothetical protein Cni_G02364 [Canna indica]
MDSKRPLHRRWRPRCCAVVCVAVLLLLALLVLILGLTVFRPRHAVTTINSVRLGGLQVGLNAPNLALDFNATLDLDITATNPNHASFRYDTGEAELYYRGDLVGEAAIPPGEVPAMGSVRTNVSLTVMAGRLIANSALYREVISGSLNFTTTTRVSGKVKVIVIKHKMVAYTTCDITVGILSRSLENYDCKYKTKF